MWACASSSQVISQLTCLQAVGSQTWCMDAACKICILLCLHTGMVLVQTYARKLGACLLGMCDSEPCSAAEDMNRWITELTSLMVCVSLGNPKGLKAFHSASMDGSSATVRQLPDSFYEDLMVGSACLSLRLCMQATLGRRNISVYHQHTYLLCFGKFAWSFPGKLDTCPFHACTQEAPLTNIHKTGFCKPRTGTSFGSSLRCQQPWTCWVTHLLSQQVCTNPCAACKIIHDQFIAPVTCDFASCIYSPHHVFCLCR